MFKSVEMVKVAVQVLNADVAKVTQIIAKRGIFHLIDTQKFSQTIAQDSGPEFQALTNRYTVLEQDVKNLFKNLSLNRAIRRDLTVEPHRDIDEIESGVRQIQKELGGLSGQLAQLEKQRVEKAEQLQRLRILESAKTDLDIVRKFTYLYKVTGFIVAKDTLRVEESLSSIRFMLIPLANIERKDFVVVLCAQQDKDVLERALTSSYFERVELPALNQGSFDDITNRLEQEIAQVIAQKRRLQQELHETQIHVVQELQLLMEKVSLASLILRSRQNYAKGMRSYIIVGWAPQTQITDLQDDVLRVTEGRVRFEVSEPEMIEEVQQGILKPPVKFDNPFLIRPFESIVFNYATQEYEEIDCTPIVAISFLTMFGIMFGDIGHGAVLGLLGYWLFKKFPQFADYGIMVMECGAASAFFGLLYGSIFGVEEFIPALLFHPATHIEQLMTYAVVLGVLMITTGIILNIVNSYRRKDYESALLGHYGIFGGIFYWIAIGFGAKYAASGQLGVSAGALCFFLGIPLGVIFFKEPLAHLLFKKQGEHHEKLSAGSIMMFFMEAVIDLMDVVIRYMAGTMSFIRTAAFALAHGGLCIAVFSLAAILHQLQGGGLWYVITVLLGNILVIALEGLVVSIQTIRLEYYEFFSKFFKGNGEKFQPLTLE